MARRLASRQPASSVVDGPLVSIVVVGRAGRTIPTDLRATLERTTYRPIEILISDAPAGAERAAVMEAAIAGAAGELVCLLDPTAAPLRPDWLGHLVETVLGGAVAAGPLVVRARGRRPVPATQREPDLTLLSAGIDFARTSGVALPRHLDVGGDPVEAAGRVVPVPAVALTCLLARREALLGAGILAGYAYDGVETGPAAAPHLDADLCLRLRSNGGGVLLDGRATVAVRTELGPEPPTPLPAPSRSIPPPDPERATFLDRWGPRLAREVLLDVIAGRHVWSQQPLTVVVCGGPDDALPNGAPSGLDWRIVRVGAPGELVELGAPDFEAADVVIVADDQTEILDTPTGLVRVAWLADPARPPTELPEYDLLVAAASDPARAVAAETGMPLVGTDLRSADGAHVLHHALVEWVEATRFAIRIGASNWPNARTWGDYHFGRMLQRAFQLSGHPTRVRLLRDWGSDAAARDDATIHVFGKVPAANRSGQVNVLWQISHPDLASRELYDDYDLAFVASGPFAERMAALAGIDVAPLHQATDPDRFYPDPTGPHHGLLYVANHRADRPVIEWLLPTEHDLAVYGRGWDEAGLDPRHHRGVHIPNVGLHRYYGAADIVLNDTWADMRAAGFISNRIYDALASGAFVLSDPVTGIDREFDGAVPTFSDEHALRAAVEHYLAAPEERAALAARGRRIVLAEHTFTQRAGTLIAALQPHLDRHPQRITELPS